jgi:hypothetical protein
MFFSVIPEKLLFSSATAREKCDFIRDPVVGPTGTVDRIVAMFSRRVKLDPGSRHIALRLSARQSGLSGMTHLGAFA